MKSEYFLKKLEKAFKARGTWYPEDSDPDGMKHPEISNRIKTTAMNGKAVWRYDHDTSDTHEKRFMSNYERFVRGNTLSRDGHNLLLGAIKNLVRDPDKHVIGSGTSNHPDPDHKELRLRHLSMAMIGKDGYHIHEQDGKLHIKAPRHSQRKGSEGGYSHWTWDGNQMDHKEIQAPSAPRAMRSITKTEEAKVLTEKADKALSKRGLDERTYFGSKKNNRAEQRLKAGNGFKPATRSGAARGRRPREIHISGSVSRGSRVADSVAKSMGCDLFGRQDRYWSLAIPKEWLDNSPFLIKSMRIRTEGRKFVSLDGDNIGASVERAAMKDDLDTIIAQSEKISEGQKAIRDWAKKHHADIYIDGGDDIAFTLPDKYIKDLETLKENYAQATGFTVTIGIGDTISRAGHAMLFGKLNGKNQINEWSPEIDQKLSEINRKMTPEEKLADHDLLPGGKGDKLKPSDVNRDQLKQGIKVEMEHTDDPRKAVEIALDHLAEDPEYYTKLATIESEHGSLKKNDKYKEVDPAVFHRQVTDFRGSGDLAAANIHPYSLEDYRQMKTFMSPDMKSGYAIKDGNELVSVHSRERGRGDELVSHAIKNGASKLDAYDIKGKLPSLYGKFGFKEMERSRFDPKYADPANKLLHTHRPDFVRMERVAKEHEHSNLNKKEDSDYIDLVHFGQKPGLTSLSPSYQGTAKQGREGKSIETSRYLLDAQGKKYNKTPFLHAYIANTGQAEPIFQSAPAKYHIRLPKNKIYDLSRDPEGILRNIKEEHSDVYSPNEHPMSHPDLVHSAIKEAGYLGWKVGNHPDERFRDAVMFYHDIPVAGKNHNLHSYDSRGHTGMATEISRDQDNNWSSTNIKR